MRDIMLIVHILSVAIFVGASFSFFILNKVTGKWHEEIKNKFNSALLSLNYLGKTGLTLLIISGGYLMTPYWSLLGEMPLLVTKLTLVFVLLIVLVLLSIKAKKAKKSQQSGDFQKVNILQQVNLIISIAVVIMAILVFH